MKSVLRALSAVGLGLTVVPALLVFMGSIEWTAHANYMIAGTVLWFAGASAWFDRSEPAHD